MALLAIPALARDAGPTPPSVRAIDDSRLVLSPGTAKLEEIVTLSRRLPSILIRVPVGGQVRIADWPVFPGARRAVTLQRHDIYAADARIVKIDEHGEVEIPRSRWLFFWGTDEDTGGRVVVSVDPDTASLRAMTMSDDGVTELTPQAIGAARRYRLGEPLAPDHTVMPPSWTCNAETLPSTPPGVPDAQTLSIGQESLNPEAVETASKSAVIAIDTDNEYMLNRFANNTTNAVNWIASLIANTNIIYERDVSLHLFQGYTILRVSTIADPYVTGSSGNADGTKLNDFSSYWGAHYGNIKRTVAALLSGKQPGGGASGIAWISGLCSTGFGYSFNQLFTSTYLYGDTLIFGHEVGHNFGSPHTHCYSPPADQCYNGEGGCYSGPESCPSPQTYQGVTNVTGTLMGYCHLLGGCNTFLVFHTRTMSEYFNSHISTAITSGCIFNVGGSLPAAPTITGISPTFGPLAGGIAVTITGTNFSTGLSHATVAFADLSGSVAVTVGTVTGNTISATTPAHSAGLVDVVVMNSDFQTATLSSGFSYQNGATFNPLTPCRVIDTRNPAGPLAGPALSAGGDRVFVVTGQCGIPPDAKAISANVTVTQPTVGGDLKLYGAGGSVPVASTAINYGSGQTRANNAVTSIGTGGGIAVHCDQTSGTVQFIVDVNGFYR